MLSLALLSFPAWAQDMQFGYVPSPGPKENPGLFVTPTRTVKTLEVSCQVGGKTVESVRSNVAAGSKQKFEFKRDPAVTTAECFIRATYTDGNVDETTVPIEWQYQSQLSVDLSRASADIEKKTVTVRASGPVTEAEIVAYGAHKAELDRRVVPVSGGPGDVSVPFVGNPDDVVLLDVTLRNESAWAGFTYSPWFLNIPHEDVLFQTDSDVIDKDQEYKLEATLQQLHDVVDKYGSVVPVKLYIAGCTDTVGDAGHNADLSRRRALSIGRWLKAHGFSYPTYYHGFGENLLAVQTGDNVDMQINRRVLYMVGANPPPAGSGVPSVSWSSL